MEKRFHFRKLLVSLLVAASVVVKAQTSVDPTVMNVAGKDVPLSEFVYIAGKNSEVNLADSASLVTYLELFKKFKLKVAEAESLGMDTTQSFVNELKGYHEQLLKSYSKDSGEVLSPDKIRYIEQNYPEYKHLMQEYRDGILLFEVSDREVWSRASSDAAGLETFFEQTKQKYSSDNLDAVRGEVIADYQSWLDNQWTKRLADKYPIKVYWEVLKKLTK
ncbi:MAG TPA: hypothetical protein PKA78_04855 [Macellibacteroides fermentans]|uniref:hypothetical protein n=1 Tax=Macellibacteroides fermentans TaxID=879969 RepID=UPI002BF1A86A|nr:hypothetical protein [Macellibacteroides fermentans]